MTTTHYDTLEISPKATAAVISAAYRTLSQKYHPDKNNGDKHCEEMMAKINVAYGVLSDPIKRKLYDEEIGLNQATSTNTNVGVSQNKPKQEEYKAEPQKKKSFEHPEQAPIQPKSGNGFVGVFVAIAIIGLLVYVADKNEEEQFKELQNKSQIEENKKQYKWRNAEGLLTGRNSPQNFQKALSEYEEIADKGMFFDKRAEQRIAEINFFGLGQNVNYPKALEWYNKCYEIECEFMVAMMYYEGIGVKKDILVAYHHFNKIQGYLNTPRVEYQGNPLIIEKQQKLMFSSKEEKEKLTSGYDFNQSIFTKVSKVKRDFLDKTLTQEEINKAQNLDIK